MFLNSQCFFGELTDDLLSICQPFSCGNEDLDDFFRNDATRYAYYLMGKSYCFRKTDDPTKIVCTFTVSNDSFLNVVIGLVKVPNKALLILNVSFDTIFE